ncbi:MAG: tRNA-binding protein [Acidimicrobiia bacterium]|nr:tRNA-binding protein [Acidimicrobiia bacterium]
MEEPKPSVDPSTFFDLDLRVGRVVAVEDFPEARRPAYRVTVDFGADLGRLATSAQVTNYEQDELLGRLVVGVCNIGTRRVAGFESRFLVLGAVRADGEVRLLTPDADVDPGTPVA